jgi:hypothetical protein
VAGVVRQHHQADPLRPDGAVRLWHRARDLGRGTHQPGRHGGSVGPTALAVLHARIFDFLDCGNGRLDPSYAAIARKAGVYVRTVATALARLRELGILNWVRRCAESWQDERFVLAQETNVYGLCSESQWRDYRPLPEPPEPIQRRGGLQAPQMWLAATVTEARSSGAASGVWRRHGRRSPAARTPASRSEVPAARTRSVQLCAANR